MLRLFVILLTAVCAHAGVSDPNFVDGRTVIVHLFEWKWADIGKECQDFLGPYGYAGVQVSPPSKHIAADGYPWWQRYQPVSYSLDGSRSGSESEFKEMVDKCNNVGVRIYVDAVINHMAADSSYTFPDVPYYPENFNVPNGRCSSNSGGIEDYSNPDEVRYCNLVGLDDIDFSSGLSSTKLVQDYLNKLLGYGVAGFRIDAAKHMDPTEIENIANGLQNVFGGRPYIYQEVIDQGGEPIKAAHYTHLGDVTEFRYCTDIARVGRGEVDLGYLYNFGESWGMLPSSQAVVFVDNHDNQRGHGGAGSVVTYTESAAYKKATAFALAWDYGTARIMSSYKFSNTDQGPPGSNGVTSSPEFNSDSSCKGDWVCEHRWRQIRNMVCFRNAAGTAPVDNWTTRLSNLISFSRGTKAFFAISNERSDNCPWLQTGLSSGTYCDLISGDPTDSGCTGKEIEVQSDGAAQICLEAGEDSMVAITYKAKSGSGAGCKW